MSKICSSKKKLLTKLKQSQMLKSFLLILMRVLLVRPMWQLHLTRFHNQLVVLDLAQWLQALKLLQQLEEQVSQVVPVKLILMTQMQIALTLSYNNKSKSKLRVSSTKTSPSSKEKLLLSRVTSLTQFLLRTSMSSRKMSINSKLWKKKSFKTIQLLFTKKRKRTMILKLRSLQLDCRSSRQSKLKLLRCNKLSVMIWLN